MNFTFCPDMGKCSGYHLVSKYQFFQKVDIAPIDIPYFLEQKPDLVYMTGLE